MTMIKELYDLFGVSPDCTDDELRRAYLFMVRQHHPDMNPGRVEIATAKTQELTKAYVELKKYRQSYTVDSTADHKVSSEGWLETIVEASFTFSFLFSGVDIEDIARRKKSFRDAWNAFRQNPSDVIRSLQLVHAAFEDYDSANDEDYLLAVGIHLDNTLSSNSPDGVLENLRDLTRWLDILGEGNMVDWIRMLIKTEAPGTWYVDSHNRGKYIRQVQLSSYMRSQIDTILDRIKTCVPGKISQVLKSQSLKDVDHKSGNALDDKSRKS